MGFKERSDQGQAAHNRLVKKLIEKGFSVFQTGWENIAGSRSILRFNRTFTSEFNRHRPDLLCMQLDLDEPFHVEVKSTSETYWDGWNFSIETASLEVCQFLDNAGVRVAIVFENRPHEFFADWAKNISPFRQNGRERTMDHAGSGTPMSLIRKSTLLPLDDFLPKNQRPTPDVAENWDQLMNQKI